MPVSIRRLAPSESGYVGMYPTSAGPYVALRGELDLAALADAWTVVRKSHPALDATITAGAHGYEFTTSDDAVGAPLTVDRPDIFPVTFEVPRVDTDVALARLHVVTVGDRHRVFQSGTHALNDAGYAFTVFIELWAHYTSLVTTGSTRPVTPHPFPTSAQHILTDVDTSVGTGRERLRGTRWYGSAPTALVPPEPRYPDVTSFNFSQDVTTMLVESAADIGMTALLSGILLCAERAGYLDDAPGATVPMGVMTLLDLRRHVDPPLAGPAVTNFVGASYTRADLAMDSDPAETGRRVVETTRADLHAGRCLATLADPVGNDGDEPPVVLSNLGPIRIELPSQLTGDGIGGFLTIDSAAFESDAATRQPSPSATIYQSCTFNGRLSIDQITVGGAASAEQRAAVADRIVSLVHAAARMTRAA